MKRTMVVVGMAIVLAFGAIGCATPKAVATDVKETVETVKNVASDVADKAGYAVDKSNQFWKNQIDKVVPQKVYLGNGETMKKKKEDIKGL